MGDYAITEPGWRIRVQFRSRARSARLWRRPDRGAARTTDRQWCRGRGKERRRQRRTRRGECEPGHRGFRRAHRQWSSVGGQRARWLFVLWERDNRGRTVLADRENQTVTAESHITVTLTANP